MTTTPENGSTGSVTILDKKYDIATTTKLELGNKGITNEQLNEIAPEIAKLTNLTKLNLHDTQVHNQDIEWLKTQLPNCDITF